MKGSETFLLQFMEGNNNRYVIPVYQRKYDWKIENCSQLYSDLVTIVEDKRSSHFFGSIVSAVEANGSIIEFNVIDGQQRLTTVTLLLLAIRDLVRKGLVKTNRPDIDNEIEDLYILSRYGSIDDKIKLKPVKSDRTALEKLIKATEDEYDQASNLTINYKFFKDKLENDIISVEEIFDAVRKLQIISITLDNDDNPQLIFESLNSTGLALSEGDKIRNYVLMGEKADVQNEYFENYWTVIERRTRNNVSGFVRDYLSIKQLSTPTINNVYQAFKKYREDNHIDIKILLEDLKSYSQYYERLLMAKSGLGLPELDDCLYRLNRLEVTVAEPFFMEVLRLHKDEKIKDPKDVEKIFLITEKYLFRRNICEVPTNALNKIFLTLNKEIIRYENNTDNYVNKLAYSLLSKRESGRFPDDEEFSSALANKQVYNMRGKYKAYLFERFENNGTKEAKDVYTLLDNGTYTIEHIMPQHLTAAWSEALGPDSTEIHDTWLHRLANLTLTGYNPNLSDKSFIEKRDNKEGGYSQSGLRMNVKIAKKNQWTLKELEERNGEMIEDALKIWSIPETSFVPKKKEYESCSLEDEDVDLTGRDIIKYSFQNVETQVSSWSEMFEHVVEYLHSKDKSVLSSIAYCDGSLSELSKYVTKDEKQLRSAIKVDDSIFVEKNTSTALKLSILRKLFNLYKADQMDLVFYLRDIDTAKTSEVGRFELRNKYWTYALPIIKANNSNTRLYEDSFAGKSNSINGWFGITGFCISCVSNYDQARVDLCLSSGVTERNKEAYDYLISKRNEIEDQLGSELDWNRGDTYKISWITTKLSGVSIANENDWVKMANFQAEWSRKFAKVIVPYLEEKYGDTSPEEKARNKRLAGIADMARIWAKNKTEAEEIVVDLDRCNRSYTRFKTKDLSQLLPDTPENLSGWNTANHYFYEIVNKTGTGLFIQLALSSKNMTEEQLKVCENINKVSPSKTSNLDWKWRAPFRTPRYELSDELTQEEINKILDTGLNTIFAMQKELLDNYLKELDKI